MTSPSRNRPFRVLFLCTGNSARSQLAEAVLSLISRRIDLLLALPVEKLERLALGVRIEAIGEAGRAADAKTGP